VLTELERRVLWFRAYGVRYPAIARSVGMSYRAVKSVARNAQQKVEQMQVREAQQVLATFGKAPGIAKPRAESAPRPQLVTVEDLIAGRARALSDLIEVG
jgi:DNA-binding CsgD family transcriptional regulator